MATTLRLRDFLGRDLANATPGTTDPALDSIGRAVKAGNVDFMDRGLIATTRANSTAYALGAYVEFSGGELLKCVVAGTSTTAQPSLPAYGATVADGTATWERVF